MDNTNQPSDGLSGQIFLSPLSNIDLSKQQAPLRLAPSSSFTQDTIQVNQSGNPQPFTLVQITDDQAQDGQVQQLYQFVPQSFESEQQQTFVNTQQLVQKQPSSSNTIELSQLNSTLPLTVSDGQLAVIESDGQHYLIVPNFTTIDNDNGNDQVVIEQQNTTQTAQISLPEATNDGGVSGTISQTQPVVGQVTTEAPSVNQESILVTSASSTAKVNMPPPSYPALKLSHQPKLPPSALRFHNLSGDGRSSNRAGEVVSSPLDMSDIIPSFFQRTVHQQMEMQGANTCRYCKFKATTLEDMEKHLLEHKNDGVVKKKQETAKAKRASKKKKAQMIRTVAPKIDTYPPKCPVCQSPLKNAAQYRKHLKLHKSEKPHRCDECGESFNKQYNLNLHKSLHQTFDINPGVDKYQCPECKKDFSRLAGLKMHITLHAEEENFICKECGDEFPTDERLTQHVAAHNIDVARHLHDKKKAVSVVADNSGETDTTIKEITIHLEGMPENENLSQLKNLKAPKINKSGRKSSGPRSSKNTSAAHQCDQCGKSFQKKSQLNRHLLIHTGEKPHKCQTCGKAFNQKGALQQHMSLHSGEKKHSCPHCPQTYRQRGNLNLHIQRVHMITVTDGKNFACQYCPCVFRKLGSLNSHVTKYHKRMSLVDSQIVTADPEEVHDKHPQPVDDIEKLLYSVYDSAEGSKVTGTSESQRAMDIVNQAMEECVRNPDVETGKDTTDILSQFEQTNVPMPGDQLDSVFDALPTSTNEIETQLETQNSNLLSVLQQSSISSSGTDAISTNSEGIQSNPLSTATSQMQNTISTADIEMLNQWTYNPKINKSKNWRTKLRDGLRFHECLYCHKEFRKPSDLQRHIRVHTLERPYKCKQCSKDFTVKSSLTAHIRSHLGIKPYRCQICHKSFTTGGSLRIHSRLHTGAKPFPCPHCDKKFRTSGQRSNHVCLHFKNKNPQPPKRKIKIKPSSDFPNVKMLPPMISTPTGRYHFDKSKTRNQESTFTGEAHKCNQCQKVFKRARSLQLHAKLHAGERPFKCSLCNKGFVALMYLKAHLKMHQEVNKFACSTCDRKFSTKGSLKRHATKHSNERPYLCPYCKKTFKTYDSCRKHIKCHRQEVVTIMENTNMEPSQVNIQSSAASNQSVPLPSTLLSTEDAISVLTPVEDPLGSSFLPTLQQPEENPENSVMKQVDPNMVQNIRNLAPSSSIEPVSAPQQYIFSTNLPQTSDNQSQNAQNLTLEELAGLSVNPESAGILVNGQSQEQIQLFEFDLAAPIETANAGQTLYMDSLALLDNMTTTPSSTDSPVISSAQVTTGRSTTHGRTKRRGNFFGGKVVQYGEQRMYQCTGCETVFSSDEFVEHAKSFSPKSQESSFLCECCCHRFSLEKHYLSHLEFHKVQTGLVYKCEKCGVGFVNNDIREEHRVNYCKGVQKNSPQKHKKKLNAPAGKQKTPSSQRTRSSFLRLSEDQNRILSQTNPNLHMTVSERILLSAVAEKDRVVETVKKKRGRFKALETNGPKHKYACQHCPKSFYKQCDLVRHIRTHTGEKPFKCQQCGKSFSVKSCLLAHEKIHSGVKEFRCHICDLMYSSKTSLKVHMRLHTGGLPFKCPHCDQRFRTSGHRKCHIASHFNDNSKKRNGKNKKNSVNDANTTQPPNADPNSVVLSDVTLTLPDGLLPAIPLQLQWNGQNFQIIGQSGKAAGDNFTLQIDSASLQQALNNTATTTSQDVVRSYTRQVATSPAPNLVIQPITLPDSMIRDQPGITSGQEVNVAVPANLAPFTQMFFPTPSTSTVQQSIGTTMPNQDQSTDACNADKIGKSGLGQKDITLVMGPEELANQDLVGDNTMPQFTLDLLSSEDIQSGASQAFS